jgi:hypothetical protein
MGPGFDMNPPPWILIALAQALQVAEAAGAKEIGVEHLRAAIETAEGEIEPAEPRGETLLPVPKRDMMLSEELRGLLESLQDFQKISVTELQRALRGGS